MFDFLLSPSAAIQKTREDVILRMQQAKDEKTKRDMVQVLGSMVCDSKTLDNLPDAEERIAHIGIIRDTIISGLHGGTDEETKCAMADHLYRMAGSSYVLSGLARAGHAMDDDGLCAVHTGAVRGAIITGLHESKEEKTKTHMAGILVKMTENCDILCSQSPEQRADHVQEIGDALLHRPEYAQYLKHALPIPGYASFVGEQAMIAAGYKTFSDTSGKELQQRLEFLSCFLENKDDGFKGKYETVLKTTAHDLENNFAETALDIKETDIRTLETLQQDYLLIKGTLDMISPKDQPNPE